MGAGARLVVLLVVLSVVDGLGVELLVGLVTELELPSGFTTGDEDVFDGVVEDGAGTYDDFRAGRVPGLYAKSTPEFLVPRVMTDFV